MAAKKVGVLIKEARTAAGMSQEKSTGSPPRISGKSSGVKKT